MKPQFKAAVFVITAASAFTVFVSTSLASPAAHNFPGYTRVVSNGQEMFCDREKDGHFLRVVCYTRNQMIERQRSAVDLDSGPSLIAQSAQFLAAGRSAN